MLKNHAFTFTTLLIIIMTFSSCKTEISGFKFSERDLRKPFDDTPLGFMSQLDTLKLTAHFSECGEFGGHKEVFSIHKNYKKEYFLKYTRDSIDLDCPPDFDDKRIYVKDTTFKMTENQVMRIRKY